MQKRLEVGQIVNTFGIKGEVKVTPFTDDINRFDDLKKVYVKTRKQEKLYKVENARYHKNMVLLKLEGIENFKDFLAQIKNGKRGLILMEHYSNMDLPAICYLLERDGGEEGKELSSMNEVLSFEAKVKALAYDESKKKRTDDDEVFTMSAPISNKNNNNTDDVFARLESQYK